MWKDVCLTSSITQISWAGLAGLVYSVLSLGDEEISIQNEAQMTDGNLPVF